MTAIRMSRSVSLFALLVERSGLSNEEVGRKVEEKKESLGHFINEDVAVRLVAKDLGIKLHDEVLEKPAVKIADLVPGINNLSLELKVVRRGNVKEFTKKDGSRGRMARIAVSDETGRVNMVLWTSMRIPSLRCLTGRTSKVQAAYTREGLDGQVEIHSGNRASIQVVDAEKGQAPIMKGRIERVYDPYILTAGRF